MNGQHYGQGLEPQKSLKLGQVTRLSFGAIVAVMVGIGISAKTSMHRVVSTSEWVGHTHAVKADLADLEKKLVDAETGQRGFIFTGEESFLEPYTAAVGEFDDMVTELKELIQDNPKQTERLEQVDQLADQKFAELAETIELKRSNKDAELMALVLSGQGKQIMDQIRVLVAEMDDEESALLEVRQQDARNAALLSDAIALGGTLLTISLSLGALVLISKQVIYPIHKVAEDLASSSSEMTSTVKDQEAIARHQAAAVQETSTTLDELNASSHQSAEQADVSAAAAKQVMALAGLGTEAVQHTLDDIHTMRSKVETIADQILSLSDQAKQIAGITDLVSDLANQTNMLALNAAVEAVRAEESGRGFAVVAAEIRKLADQSKGSADKISVLITQVQSAIAATVTTAKDGRTTAEQGAQTVQGTADTFIKVADAIHNVVTSSEQISLNARQQAIAIQQVVTAMDTLNHEAVRGAAGISQTRASAERLNSAVEKLQAVV
ncbi:MAG TPA: CHASE3 domain-containing protein [Trichocoleus sp.]